MADALDSGSSGSDTVWVQVPSTAGVIEQTGRKTCLFYYVAEPDLNPRVQGLLDINVSSVGSTGKRFTESLSGSVSLHQLQFDVSICMRSASNVSVGDSCQSSASPMM